MELYTHTLYCLESRIKTRVFTKRMSMHIDAITAHTYFLYTPKGTMVKVVLLLLKYYQIIFCLIIKPLPTSFSALFSIYVY